MDSGNSGSPQSSSAGDDDYDSRTAAAAAFINPGPHPPPRPSTMFDPFSNYTQQQWPGSGSASLRSDPHLHTLINPFAPSSFQQPPPPLPQVDGPDDNSKNTMNAGGTTAARNPRKRSRASRRAPTTVLTTDTNNFRAMVQEFTGIPAPPFSSPSFPRPHHNLFGRSTMDPARHPFAQTTSFLAPSMINYQQLPFPPHLHTSDTNNNNNNNNNNNILLSNIITNNNNNSSSNNQNPFFSSLLQTNPSKFTFSGSPIMASEPHDRAGPGPEEFGLGSLGMDHRLNVAAPNDLRSLIPSDKGPAREDHGRDVVKWGRNDGSNNNNKDIDNMGGDQVKPVNGGYEFTGLSCQGEKGSGSGSGPETTRVGDQGMVESWINNSSE